MRQAAFRSGVFEEFTRQRVTDWILETAPIWLPSGLQHLSAAGGGRGATADVARAEAAAEQRRGGGVGSPNPTLRMGLR